jgi:pimeloyl-ACP methyl ester carboxylesterase
LNVKKFRRLLKGLAIGLAAVVLLVALQLRPDLPVETLIKEYGGEPSQFMEIDGVRVHYRDEGEGEVIVLIHGLMASLHTWDGWAGALQGEFRVIRLDLPAFGLTGPIPGGAYSYDDYADFLARFLDRLGVEKCSIAGNSLGGGVAWAFASRYPGRVDKLILVDAAGFSVGNEIGAVAQAAGFPLVRSLLRYATPRYVINYFLRQVYGDKTKLTAETVTRYYRLLRREGNREIFFKADRTITAYPEEELKRRLASIEAPVLIMWGEKDAWIPLANAFKFQESIPGSRVIVYEGAGHIPMEEIPAETVRDARAFLR